MLSFKLCKQIRRLTLPKLGEGEGFCLKKMASKIPGTKNLTAGLLKSFWLHVLKKNHFTKLL